MAPLRRRGVRRGGTLGDRTAAANRRGATRDARCPYGAQREPPHPHPHQSPHTATTHGRAGHPGVINGAPTAAGRPAAMKHGDETVAANRRGATRDARCPTGAQRPRRTCTRVNHRTATAHGRAGHPCIKNDAPVFAEDGKRRGADCPEGCGPGFISSRVRGCRWR